MSNGNVQLKCTWKNYFIWFPIMLVLGIAARAGMWYLLIYMGSVDIFSDYFCDMSLGLLIASVLIPVICYLISYKSYMNLAGKNPHRLQEIASGTLGKPWLAPFIGMVIGEITWTLVSTGLVAIACEFSLDVEDDLIVMWTFVGIHGLNFLADLITYFLGKAFFKPDLVQNH